jgi:trehalose 6-phosphate synthase/trehalose 6-phosphate phosphatase
VREALQQLQSAAHTRLVIVSGRPAADVEHLLGVTPIPEIWGSHGLERLQRGTLHREPLSAAQHELLRTAERAALQVLPETAVEVKHGCVAVHWRGLPAAQHGVRRAQIEAAWREFQADGLVLHAFDGGLELRRADINKGTVIEELIRNLGSPACIAYLGDDLTDEDAFAALSGRGLTVLVRSAYRPTLAEVWLRPPEQVVRFLVGWHEAASHSRRT